MEFNINKLILQTLPENLWDNGSKLIESSCLLEQERLEGRSFKHRKHGIDPSKGSEIEVEDLEKKIQRKIKAEQAAVPIAIAKLVMEVWSPSMRQYAEKLILKKAVQENFLEEELLKWVFVLNSSETQETNGWLIEDQDNAILELIWYRFNIKQHYSEVCSHRKYVQLSYDRLKKFMPNLCHEVVLRHDLSKFAFNQAIGYTLKWVHNVHHSIWKSACDLHLHNEPHHPKTWSALYKPEQKLEKVRSWMGNACDAQMGCLYGVNLDSHPFDTEDLSETFLLESFIDMVAVEWERKKGCDMEIPLRQLVYMDNQFLKRYSKKQQVIVSDLIRNVVSSDESWKKVLLNEREKMLLSTVPEHKQGVVVTQIEIQKRNELNRQKLAKKESQTISELKIDDQLNEELSVKAENIAFFIMVCKVVIEQWDSSFYKFAEEAILRHAVEEKIIEENYLQWISVFDKPIKTEEENENCTREISTPSFKKDVIIELLWKEFKLGEHFSQVMCHRRWIKESYLRLASFLPELPEELLDRHDLTKLSLSQAMGYTLKWIHGINHPLWRKACDLHLNFEPHHPQMWSQKHTPDIKKSCLESWLCTQAEGSRYGIELSSLDFSSSDMARVFLVESLIDMVAVEWERNKGQRPDLTYKELIYMEDRFLSRYSESDKATLIELMNVIKDGDKQTGS